MKYFLTTILLLLFAQFNAQAQSLETYEPIQSDNGFTPYQRNLSFELQFLTKDDLSKVLFNPSYLSSIEESRFYTTVSPGSNRNYRFAYLSKNKWLLSGSVRNRYSENSSENDSFLNYMDVQVSADDRFINLREQETTLHFERKNSSFFAESRFSKVIGNNPQKPRSFGLLAAFQKSTSTDERDEINNRLDTETWIESDTLRRIRTTDRDFFSTRFSETNSYKMLGGIEYSYSSAVSNGVHRIYTQYNDSDQIYEGRSLNLRNDSTQYFDGSSNFSSLDRRDNTYANRKEYLPWTIGYLGHANRNIDWLSNDYIYATVESYYSFGKSDINLSALDERVGINNGTIYTSTEDDFEVDKPNGNEYQTSAKVTLGYAVSFELEKMYLFTGISNSLQYIQFEGYIGNSNSGILKFNNGYHFFKVNLPFYSEYIITDWLSIFGGANMTFEYSATNNRTKLNTSIYDDFPDESESINNQNTSANYDDMTRTFFGLKASHESGLHLMADINGDLARLSGWYFTLGYQF